MLENSLGAARRLHLVRELRFDLLPSAVSKAPVYSLLYALLMCSSSSLYIPRANSQAKKLLSHWMLTTLLVPALQPWSLAVPVAFFRSRLLSHRSLWLTTSREDRLVPFAASWFIAVFGFFSLSASQLPSYYLPLSPAVALLAASLLTWRERRQDQPDAEEQAGAPPDVARLTAASTLAAYALEAVALSQLPAMLASSADAKVRPMLKSVLRPSLCNLLS